MVRGGARLAALHCLPHWSQLVLRGIIIFVHPAESRRPAFFQRGFESAQAASAPIGQEGGSESWGERLNAAGSERLT